MRLVFTPPVGFNSVTQVICHEGHFYALCAQIGAGVVKVHVRDLTDNREWNFRESGGSSRWVRFFVYPVVSGTPGLCVSLGVNEAVCLTTGERFTIVPTGDYDPNAHWNVRRQWLATRDLHAIPAHDARAVGTDSHVFLTGSGAKAVGEVAMGPAQMAKVAAVKGLSKGHVVSYRRGGEARVLRLTDRKHNAVHLVAAQDGLTFLAVCRSAVYHIDADLE